jgi:cell division transport system permease protein
MYTFNLIGIVGAFLLEMVPGLLAREYFNLLSGAAPARFGLLTLIALLAAGALGVVGNTIRLDVGARREEIAVLQQLGATDAFVRRPFVYLGAWYGAASGALALAVLLAARLALAPPLARLGETYGMPLALEGLGAGPMAAVLAAATALGALGAWLASGHHLRQTRPTDL